MLSLLAPGALLALTALAVPPLLHLRRRSEQQVVRFAALRWLGAGARPRRQVRLEQKLLLAVRLALFAVLALLLARPVWRSEAVPSRSWVLVMPGVNPAAAPTLPDAAAAEWHWLSPGFPPLDSTAPAAPGESLFSLLRQIDAELPPGAPLQVLVPQELSGLDAERPQLRRPLHWQIVPGSSTAPVPAAANAVLNLALRYEAPHPTGEPLVSALAAAWRSTGLSVNLEQAQGGTAPEHPLDALFWLGGDLPLSLRQWVRDGGTVITAAPNTSVAEMLPSALPLGRGRLLLLSSPLDPATNPALRDPELPTRLLNLLRRNAATPDRAPAIAVAPVTNAGPDAERKSTTALDAYAALLAALLFLVERMLALRAQMVRR